MPAAAFEDAAKSFQRDVGEIRQPVEGSLVTSYGCACRYRAEERAYDGRLEKLFGYAVEIVSLGQDLVA